MSSPQATLAQRVFAENRKPIIWLAAALSINVLVYAFGVYPLGQRVANVAQRNETAARALAAARLENEQASGALTGKDQAQTKLAKFYTDVLPRDLASARALTHLRLAQLARQSGLRMDDATYEQEERRKGSLARLQITMNLAGTYSAFRTFVHQLESSPEFVVIDNVELSEDREGASQLSVRLELSTYFRNAS